MQTVVNISVIKLFLILKEVTDGSLVQQGVTQHPEHIERASSKFAVMLHDGHKAVCDDSNVYLYYTVPTKARIDKMTEQEAKALLLKLLVGKS